MTRSLVVVKSSFLLLFNFLYKGFFIKIFLLDKKAKSRAIRQDKSCDWKLHYLNKYLFLQLFLSKMIYLYCSNA